MLSSNLANFVAHTLPFFELVVGLWLVSGILLRIPSLITTLMLGGFLCAMIRAYVLGLKSSAAALGRRGSRTDSSLRDGSFFALALAVTIGAFLIARKKSAPESSAAAAAELQQAR